MADRSTYTPYELGNGYHPDRRSAYRRKYCKVAEDYLARHSMVALTGVLKVTKKTIQEWRKQFPEFDAACCIGEAKRAEHIEKILYSQAEFDNKKSAASAIFLAKNWSELVDKQIQNHEFDEKVESITVEIKRNTNATEPSSDEGI